MINKGRDYEITSLIDKNCPVCNKLDNIYNLEGNRVQFKIPKEHGEGYVTQISSSRDTQIIDFKMTFNRKVELKGKSKTPHIDMFFCMGDHIDWNFKGDKRDFQLLKGESFFAKNKGIEKIKNCIYEKDQKLHFVELKVHPKKFNEIVENIQDEWRIFSKDKCEEIFHTHKMSSSINVILKQMISCPYNNGLRKIYMDGKVLELFSVYFNENIREKDNHNLINLSKEDIKSIYRAKEILDNNLGSPPTLLALAKLIYINEFKLKNGFKEVFNTTVHSYIIDRRLEAARDLLEGKTKTVSEVASIVGYSNASHFALAFRKKFGVNPGYYLKNVAGK
ncbi:AraC family transcriptional regulator [Clostridium hydrogeniformans]|uniref:AraC family transcriptional regulator n=1 Tax=Clostridium hydrogeniformans TaxID=349933 RepID=UPI000557B087|nr:AraC family transcriptional regulator [Clostridium hydrogeniformans]